MPIYEYNCNSCDEIFALLQWKPDNEVKCPRCGSQDVRKLLSQFSCHSSGDLGPSSGFSGG